MPGTCRSWIDYCCYDERRSEMKAAGSSPCWKKEWDASPF
jgi:hypothetical protein